LGQECRYQEGDVAVMFRDTQEQIERKRNPQPTPNFGSEPVKLEKATKSAGKKGRGELPAERYWIGELMTKGDEE
jgi:hypothetical protein